LTTGSGKSLREHPVLVREEAVRAIGTRSLALDVHIWLAYCPALSECLRFLRGGDTLL
jgi:hypothetical protein